MRAAALVAVIAVAAAATATDVHAAERPTVVVTSGQEQKFGIALQKFAGGPDAEAYREGLVAALEFSSLFRVIDRKAFLGPTTTKAMGARARVECSEWSAIGADVFVEGALSTSGDQFTAKFRVWDLAGCRRKLGRSLQPVVRYQRSGASNARGIRRVPPSDPSASKADSLDFMMTALAKSLIHQEAKR